MLIKGVWKFSILKIQKGKNVTEKTNITEIIENIKSYLLKII